LKNLNGFFKGFYPVLAFQSQMKTGFQGKKYGYGAG